MEAWREELYHSAKGSVWKDHKYVRKDGDRYIYNVADDVVKSPDLDKLSDELGKVEPVKKVRDVMATPIWSPNKEDEDLIDRGQQLIAKLFEHEDKKTTLAKR